MSIFSSITNTIFGYPAVVPAAAASAVAPKAIQQPVDIQKVLNQISADKGNPDLNWQIAIVDLMKLLGIDSNLANRAQLATELGYTGDKNGSAEMNIWLHKATMQKLADHDGRHSATMLA